MLQMVPPRVLLADGDGFITREWYRLLAALYSDSPGAREMAQSLRRLVTGTLTGSPVVRYTAADAVRAQIKAATLCNSTGGAVSCSVWLVPEGGSPDATNVVLSAVSVAAGASRVCSELVDQVVETGGTLQAQGLGVTLVVTGIEIT